MYVISLTTENRVADVYDTDQFVDEGVATYPISNEQFQLIWQSGKNGNWIYQNGVVTYDPLPEPEPYTPPTNAGMPTGQIPQAIL